MTSAPSNHSRYADSWAVKFFSWTATPVKALLLLALCLAALPGHLWAIGQTPYVENAASPGSFPLAQGNNTATLYVDSADWPGVTRAVTDLQADINRVTSHTPAIAHDDKGLAKNTVIIGTIGKSPLIDQLIRDKKIDASQITSKWESFFLQTVANPLPGVASALVIAGSDKRGTIYGIYDLSEEIGVSPWYWWDDVTPAHQDALFVKAGKYQQGEPSVKYRGIFLNDESPDLSNWIKEKFGLVPGLNNVANYNHEFYAKVFELILRLKGNYLWPAMWNNAFNEDDPENPRLADEYGIVMGTSHQEPMLRAQKEWDRLNPRLNWSAAYQQNPQTLENFWADGVKRNKDFESIFTLGLRAENDSGAPVGADVTEQIVSAQRKILAQEINPDVTKIPQLWCLYKEVQGYYDSGLRVPDDVTLLWAEDNWGDVRRLPTAEERQRSGGAGIYYHFDYHGGPRSYQWVNTSPIAKIWDQMSLAKEYGADRIWIVNVGHFKGYEFPMEFFLNLAWDTKKWTNADLDEYTRLWAAREFGEQFAQPVADIIEKYTQYNGRRKPELLEPATYSLIDYQEADTVVADYNAIVVQAEDIYAKLPADKRDAFFELVLFPAKASAQVNALYVAAAKNALYAAQGRASTNDFADQSRALFQADADLKNAFDQLGGGKWEHFMDQPHLGYTSWQDPPQNRLNIKFSQVAPPAEAALGVAVEGSASAWPGTPANPILPSFDVYNQQRHYLDVFNKGQAGFDFTATASDPWIVLGQTHGTIDKEQRLWVSVDWSQAPAGSATGSVKITGANGDVTVKVNAFNPAMPARDEVQGFVEGEGVVSIEAEHYTKKTDAGPAHWEKIEDYGRTLSAMRATAPVDAPSTPPGPNSPCLEYQMYLFTPGPVTAYLTVAPTLNFVPGRGLQVAVSFDDEIPQVLTLVPANFTAQNGNRDWEESVKANARIISSTHPIVQAGYHTFKVWMVDPAVVLEKIVLDTGGLKPSYLGPPESYHRIPPAITR
jgi:hypothetical protein